MSAETSPAASDTINVPFALNSPGARNVYVALFFNEWAAFLRPAQCEPVSQVVRPMVREWVRLEQVRPGLWSGEVALPVGRHEYLFLVDGTWVVDPEALDVCPDGDGSFNAVRSVVPAQVLVEPHLLAIARAI